MSYTILFKERPATLKRAKVYESEDSGFLHLALIYEYPTDDGIYELHLPRIKLPFSTASTPLLKRKSHEGMNMEFAEVYGQEFKVKQYADKEFKNETPAYHFIVKIHDFEKPAKEMTIAEIEEALGHKVKIVDGKEN